MDTDKYGGIPHNDFYYILQRYKNTKQEIYAYFQYEKGWGDLQIEDFTDRKWSITDDEIIVFDQDVENINEGYSCGHYYIFEVKHNGAFPSDYFSAFVVFTDENDCISFAIFDNANKYNWENQGNDYILVSAKVA